MTADGPDELPDSLCTALRRHWDLETTAATRLGSGESVVYRVGEQVVRVAPAFRTLAELAWSFGVVTRLARRVPEVPAPCLTGEGHTTVTVDGRVVSVWPVVDGAPGDDRDPGQREQAAVLLGRLHRAAAGLRAGARPSGGPKLAPPEELADPELDAWLAAFDRATASTGQVLHGDFYAGNVLVASGRIVALLDWDDVLVGPPERELAWAAWEWSDGLWTLDLDAARRFIVTYTRAGGPARAIGDTELRQLVRERLRADVAYDRAARARAGVEAVDADDRRYEARQINAFHALG